MKVKLFAKKLFFVLMCFLLVPFFAGCGENKNADTANKNSNSSQNSSTENNKTENNKTETKKANLSLVGKWEGAADGKNFSQQEATITGDKIEISWVNNKDNVEALKKDSKAIVIEDKAKSEEEAKQKLVYWVGTYKAPNTTEDKYTWTSSSDTEALKKAEKTAVLASQYKTKEFKYENGVLSYEVKVLDKTQTIKLKRVSA